MKPPYVYEIEFDLLGSHRDEYERWLDRYCLDWINQRSVAGFEARSNEQGLSPEVKFVIEFDSIGEWAQFVESEEHGRATETIATVATGRDATLWERSGIDLDMTGRSESRELFERS
ncbi:MAG: hypothetical protein QXG03_05905 [Halalkalicoccus sp.]